MSSRVGYCAKEDVIGEIPLPDLAALTDDTGDGNVSDDILNTVIANASDLIDSKISNIYVVPLPNPTSVVKSMCLSIVCYRLYRRRQTVDEKNKFYSDYKDALDRLNGIGDGTDHLDLTVARDFPQVEYTGRGTGFGPLGSNWLANSQ